MKAIKGVLLTCDQTTKQVILQLNDTEHFVIEDLDETHLFVNADCVQRVTAELERLLEENSYKLEMS